MLSTANLLDRVTAKMPPLETIRARTATMISESVLETNYREKIDNAYAKEKSKVVRPCTSFVKKDRFYQVLAVEFALSAAEDVTQRLNLEAKMIERDSDEYLSFVFSGLRIKSAWDRMAGPPPRLFSSLSDRTFNLLKDLSTPLATEQEIADASSDRILRATTEPFGDILAFLKTELDQL